MDLPRKQPHRLQIIDVINVAGIFQHRRHIRSEKGFPIRNANDHGTVFSGGIDFSRIVFEHQSQGIRSPNPHHHSVDCVNGTDLVLLIVVVHQFDRNLGIRGAVEFISVALQFGLEFLVILNDSIVYADHIGFHCAAGRSCGVSADVGMGIDLGRFSVGGPSSMANATGTGQRSAAINLL